VSEVTAAAAVDPKSRAVEALAAEANDRAGRRIDGPNGLFAVVDDRWPRSHDSNKVVARWAVEPDVLLAFTEASLGGAGVPHRQVVVLADGARAAAAARAVGYTVARVLIMVLPGDTDLAAPDPAIDVRAVEEATVRPLLEQTWQAGAPELEIETVRQLVGRRDTYAGSVTPFVAYADGVPVAHADLRVRGSVAEIDTVGTLPEHRNRGYARALVRCAARQARASGADVVFLQADADDWPRDLYARLGFVTVGTTYELHRSAPAD
jgi:ribosomal protein S18 acetylase RimI-like enzyme